MKPELHESAQPILQWLDQRRAWMEDRLLELVSINSGSHNPVGIDRVGEYFAALFADRLEAAVDKFSLDPWQRVDMQGQVVEQELGSLWRIRKRPDAPIQVLLSGHLDTVFGAESGFQKSTYLDKNTLNGPGAADMKGGILVMLCALEALEQHPDHYNVGWTVLLNPDEEVGSPGSAGWFAREAPRHHLGMLYEPALPDGNLAGGRKGSGNFTLSIGGRSAHAGRNPEEGRNAISAAAHAITLLERINGAREGLTLNTGIIAGGTTTNQVPDSCVVKFNVRIRQPEDADWCLTQLENVQLTINQAEGFNASLHGSFGRMPKVLDDAHVELYSLLQSCGHQLNLDLNWQSTGGVCDGNNLSTHGLPNIDTLGVRGGLIHSPDEFICLDSLTERAKLSALLLITLAHGGLPDSLAEREVQR
ncbi:hydrolase [Pontibacterium sp.]|uniref:hydrolase n=1 Tax=Pontibacterium sp. TaxID=2036026 RepID=UPI0035111EC5